VTADVEDERVPGCRTLNTPGIVGSAVNYALLFNGSFLVFGLAAAANALVSMTTDGVTLIEVVLLGAGLLIAVPAAVALYRGDDPFETSGRHWLAILAAVAVGLYLLGLAVRYLG
jgi:hypothetical protein